MPWGRNAKPTARFHYSAWDGTQAGFELDALDIFEEMTDDLLAYSVAQMKDYGIVDSGDALQLGIGAMTDARMKEFFDKMVRAGVVKGNLDYRKSYTLQFVNKKVGLELRK